MPADWVMKKNDTRPKLRVPLLLDGNATLASASSVKFLMKGLPPNTSVIRSGNAVIVNAASNLVEYTWVAQDTATAGSFQMEFEITWSDGGIETVPNDSYWTVDILADLG